MTSGSGISHSERALPEDRKLGHTIEGLQFWVALPDGREQIDPSFQHYDAKSIPSLRREDAVITLIAGAAFGLHSPVATTSPLVLFVFEALTDAEFDFTSPGFELGLYVAHGEVRGLDQTLPNHQMAIFEDGVIPRVQIKAGSRLVVLGGEVFTTPRLMWWNFVSSSREKIDAAKAAWKSGDFPMVPGETDRIVLPD